MALIVGFVQALLVFAVLQGTQAENKCIVTRRRASQADIDAILKIHNTLRQQVANGKQNGQPAASNMNELIWNSSLATSAQKLADLCKFEHDHPKVAGFAHTGQNLAISWGSDSNDAPKWDSSVQSWYNEVKDFKKNAINPFKYSSNPVIGHYTQVAWATTKYVGCGYSFYKKDKDYYKLYVCNYGEGGNVEGQGSSMYLTGTACSNCKICSKTYPGLCSA